MGVQIHPYDDQLHKDYTPIVKSGPGTQSVIIGVQSLEGSVPYPAQAS